MVSVLLDGPQLSRTQLLSAEVGGDRRERRRHRTPDCLPSLGPALEMV